jgi:hypothetical protein
VSALRVVCPVYCDVPAFRILRERILEVVAGDPVLADRDVRFLVVDDTAGRDPAIGGLDELPDVEVLRPPFNLGHQRALVYALRLLAPRLAEDEVVVTMDADGEDRPEDLPRLVAPLLEAPADWPRVVLARRTRRRETALFRLFYAVYATVFRLLTGVVVRSGNFAAYRGRLAADVLRHPSFDLCYSATLLSLDLDVRLVPAERGERYAGRSRMGYQRLFLHGLRMLAPFVDRIALRALVLFFVTAGTAVLLAIAVVVVRLATDAAIPGWATTTLGLLVVVSFTALGNLFVLFFLFSHTRGISLANLEEDARGRVGSASAPADRALD